MSPTGLSQVVDPDEQGPALVVEEPGHGLDDHGLHLFVLALFDAVAGVCFELDVAALAVPGR